MCVCVCVWYLFEQFANRDNLNGIIGTVLATAENNQTGEIWVTKGQFVFAVEILADSNVQESIESENIGSGLAREIVTMQRYVLVGRAQMGSPKFKSLPQFGNNPASRLDVEEQELELLDVAVVFSAEMVKQWNESWSWGGKPTIWGFIGAFFSSIFVSFGGGCWSSDCRAVLIQRGFRRRRLLFMLQADSVIYIK